MTVFSLSDRILVKVAKSYCLFNSTISSYFETAAALNNLYQSASSISSLQWEYIEPCPSTWICGAFGSTPSKNNDYGSSVYWTMGRVYLGPFAKDTYHYLRPAL